MIVPNKGTYQLGVRHLFLFLKRIQKSWIQFIDNTIKSIYIFEQDGLGHSLKIISDLIIFKDVINNLV